MSAPSPQVERLVREAFAVFNGTLSFLSPRADGTHLPEGAFTEQVREGWQEEERREEGSKGGKKERR